ncbi:MauE/DoxX family redox-associated membrane protein [Sphingobacterium sp. ML3W]|uniref:MauE/DoxX family redox-associated membrane protein n=1 Tax=Sphingobacterium sp. ML3W TaxID=1538644 RepID=UPI00068CB079|nr:MauE/DoxX family redox-associated membrane protein [Sphingobacterium sp. ML3W]
MIATFITYIIAATFALLWAYIALPKLARLKSFGRILGSQAIPKWTVPILTWLIPLLEICAVCLLLFPETMLLGLYFSFGLMLIFTLYVSGIIFQIYDIYPSSSGALFKRMTWRKHLKVNIGLTCIALVGVLMEQFNLFRN